MSYSARRNEGGVLRDLIHEIDYASWLFGAPAVVSARIANTGRLGIDAEEAADLVWETPNGTVVSIRLDYLTRPSRRFMRASGVLGTLAIDLVRNRVALECVDETALTRELDQPRDRMMAEQASSFLSAVGGEDHGDLATLDDGAWALAICDAARLSSETGRPTQVRDWRVS